MRGLVDISTEKQFSEEVWAIQYLVNHRALKSEKLVSSSPSQNQFFPASDRGRGCQENGGNASKIRAHPPWMRKEGEREGVGYWGRGGCTCEMPSITVSSPTKNFTEIYTSAKITNVTCNSLKNHSVLEISMAQSPSKITENNSQRVFFGMISCQKAGALWQIGVLIGNCAHPFGTENMERERELRGVGLPVTMPRKSGVFYYCDLTSSHRPPPPHGHTRRETPP